MTLEEARQTLEIEEDASSAKIEEARRDLLFFWDPDKCDGNERRCRKAEEMLQKINEAYEVVKRFGKHNFIFSEIYKEDRALELLRKGTNRSDAEFREGQEEAIRHVVNGRGRMLVVQKTGWGKSFVYFVATKLLREAGMGPALLVSPLLALIRNQIAAAKRMGVKAETINSDNEERWREIEDAFRRDEVDILLISPERLSNERFNEEVLASMGNRIALFVIDEAHCISDWGHDFRPDYRRIERTIDDLPANLRLLATTATANDRVIKDLEKVLGTNLETSRGDLARPSLALQTIRLPSQAERLAWLAERLPALPGSGIVYTLTVRDAGTVAAWLRSRGLEVESYTSETSNREKLEQALLDNRVKALVATTALGMGFDKPDLAFVVHYQVPGSAVAYYQQVGRAGRALDAAYGVLLSGWEDTEITDYFIKSAFPTPNEVKQIIEALKANPEGLSRREIKDKINVRAGRIDKTIKLLSLESPAPVAKQGTKWQLTAANLSDEFWERVDRLTELRREEQAQMQEYVGLPSGHMEFLIRALDSDPGSVSPPATAPALPASTDPVRVREAVAFLRGSSLPIDPRRRWPPGKVIDPEHRAQPGRALCVWGDSGWGSLVRQGKYEDDRFSDELAGACAALVREWRPDPFPQWVTAVPSLRRPELVPDFARRLAHALRLPFREALEKKESRPEQKTMENSDKQARNVLGSLTVNKGAILPTPVLLVDDMVDSRWTFTVVARELRRRGGGEVWPLALAVAGGN